MNANDKMLQEGDLPSAFGHVTLGWCTILIIPAILGWALVLSWLLDGDMWVRRKLHTAEEELDGLDQPEESGNQVNVICATADGRKSTVCSQPVGELQN